MEEWYTAWGYWGIVAGLVSWLAIGLASVHLLSYESQTAERRGVISSDQGTAESRNKHAA
jgi:hypothetical protein